MEREEIQNKLKTSVEVTAIKKWILSYILLIPLCCLVHYLTIRNVPMLIPAMVFYPVVGLSALIPLMGYQLWQLWRIFRRAESYEFYRVQMRELHGKWKNHGYYFTVELEIPGGIRRVKTRPIFQTWGPINPLVGDYLNFRATIAYNEETGEVVVIG